MRIIAFDTGSKRIGVAASDETALIAQGVGYIENNKNLKDKISILFKRYNPEEIVIGEPKSMDGRKRENKSLNEFLSLVRSIAGDKKIILWDERLTTHQAEKILIKSNVSRKKRKKNIDKLSATIILQSYLDYKNYRKK